MITPGVVSDILEKVGHRVHVTEKDCIRVHKDARTGFIAVCTTNRNTTHACILTGQLAEALEAAGCIVEEVDEVKTRFFVTGWA